MGKINFGFLPAAGNGFIPTAALKEILGALDDKLSSADLDNIVDEIDEDGSGTVDFDGKGQEEGKGREEWRRGVGQS